VRPTRIVSFQRVLRSRIVLNGRRYTISTTYKEYIGAIWPLRATVGFHPHRSMPLLWNAAVK